MATIEIKVPDIGNYKDVPVIELLVKPGDVVKKDQGLVTLESDKATMEVPSPEAGTIKELRVKVGDKLGEGAIVAVLESGAPAVLPSPAGRGAGGEGASPAQPSSAPPGKSAPSPGPTSHPLPGGEAQAKPPVAAPAPKAAAGTGRKADIECQVAVLGSGPGGYTAAFRAADLE